LCHDPHAEGVGLSEEDAGEILAAVLLILPLWYEFEPEAFIKGKLIRDGGQFK
jgi:hypothetical protein